MKLWCLFHVYEKNVYLDCLIIYSNFFTPHIREDKRKKLLSFSRKCSFFSGKGLNAFVTDWYKDFGKNKHCPVTVCVFHCVDVFSPEQYYSNSTTLFSLSFHSELFPLLNSWSVFWMFFLHLIFKNPPFLHINLCDWCVCSPMCVRRPGWPHHAVGLTRQQEQWVLLASTMTWKMYLIGSFYSKSLSMRTFRECCVLNSMRVLSLFFVENVSGIVLFLLKISKGLTFYYNIINFPEKSIKNKLAVWSCAEAGNFF